MEVLPRVVRHGTVEENVAPLRFDLRPVVYGELELQEVLGADGAVWLWAARGARGRRRVGRVLRAAGRARTGRCVSVHWTGAELLGAIV